MIVPRGELDHAAAETQSRVRLGLLAQLHAEIAEHVAVFRHNAFLGFCHLFQRRQRRMALLGALEPEERLAEGFAHGCFHLLCLAREFQPAEFLIPVIGSSRGRLRRSKDQLLLLFRRLAAGSRSLLRLRGLDAGRRDRIVLRHDGLRCRRRFRHEVVEQHVVSYPLGNADGLARAVDALDDVIADFRLPDEIKGL